VDGPQLRLGTASPAGIIHAAFQRPSSESVVDIGASNGTALAVAERFPEVEVLRGHSNLGAAGRTLDTLYSALR
jgi:hypothetical protein